MKLKDAENVLIVEGQDDRFAVIGLMEHHCPWPDSPPWPVFVEAAGGVDTILKKGYLSGVIKASMARRVGVVLDADKEPAAIRYKSVRALSQDLFPDLPVALPEAGVAVGNDEGKRLGVWVMPDNRSSGILEDFLVPLVPMSQTPL